MLKQDITRLTRGKDLINSRTSLESQSARLVELPQLFEKYVVKLGARLNP